VARNTPTGVGKTVRSHYSGRPGRKHPHGRGEDQSISVRIASQLETPPRAWGRPPAGVKMFGDSGNTPTGVGKTVRKLYYITESTKHPHGRGEDRYYDLTIDQCLETPPRAWGRLASTRRYSINTRNTPTGVGKTVFQWPNAPATGKHPHGRGEDTKMM